jgi:hypothetical protein
MGINAPGGYANTIRDAQYRRWTRGSDYDGYRGDGYGYRAGAEAYDGAYEGSYEGTFDASRETDAYRAGRRGGPYGPGPYGPGPYGPEEDAFFDGGVRDYDFDRL